MSGGSTVWRDRAIKAILQNKANLQTVRPMKSTVRPKNEHSGCLLRYPEKRDKAK
jgi:hypothetical protein